jgi:hypothetical protein
MSDNRLTITLRDPQTGHTAWVKAWVWCKAMLFAGHTLAVEIVCEKSREQEKLYHSCFRDLARDCLLGGQKNDDEAWKRATLYAFYMATKDDPEFAADWRARRPRMIPTLDGDGMLMINIESKKFTKRLAQGFITFLHATGDLRGVRWSRTSLGREAPDEATSARREEVAA